MCRRLVSALECITSLPVQVLLAISAFLTFLADYDTLEIIHTARRLYRREKGPMDTSEKQELSRRFAEGYRRLLLMTDGKPPPEWLDLQRRLIEYRK